MEAIHPHINLAIKTVDHHTLSRGTVHTVHTGMKTRSAVFTLLLAGGTLHFGLFRAETKLKAADAIITRYVTGVSLLRTLQTSSETSRTASLSIS